MQPVDVSLHITSSFPSSSTKFERNHRRDVNLLPFLQTPRNVLELKEMTNVLGLQEMSNTRLVSSAEPEIRSGEKLSGGRTPSTRKFYFFAKIT